MTRSIRNCSVCVVGGAGFLGSHLVRHLEQERYCNVLVIDNLITGRRRFLTPTCSFEHHDIAASEEYTYKLLKTYEVEYVFNYAAEPYIPVSFARPLHVFSINAFGALKLINAAQEAGCKGILQVSSAEIYGDLKGKISETDEVRPHSSYGASKAAIDYLVQARWREARTPVIALRQFNCVGERETHPYVIPEIIAQLINSNTVALGNNSTRDFQYAGDAVKMAVELLEKGEFGEVYNMGSEQCITIYELAELIGKVMNKHDVRITVDESRRRPWEIWHLQSNNAKLYSVINTRPSTSLRAALNLTVNDYIISGKRWAWEF